MTFTNKAAQEMRTRIRKMVDMGSVNDYICTDSNLDLEVIVSNDGFVEIGDSTWTCNIEGNNRSYCSAKK